MRKSLNTFRVERNIVEWKYQDRKEGNRMDMNRLVRDTIMKNPKVKAGVIADMLGLVDELGYDEATDYVRAVRRRMRANGDLIPEVEKPKYASPEDRLADVLKLFELRGYNVRKKPASFMLLGMCYWTMSIAGNVKAVCDTMDMNDQLKRPFPFQDIERICNDAQELGFAALDEVKNYEARALGYPGAGLNWTSVSLYHKFEVTDEELPHLKTIGKPIDKNKPWGIPNPARMPTE